LKKFEIPKILKNKFDWENIKHEIPCVGRVVLVIWHVEYSPNGINWDSQIGIVNENNEIVAGASIADLKDVNYWCYI